MALPLRDRIFNFSVRVFGLGGGGGTFDLAVGINTTLPSGLTNLDVGALGASFFLTGTSTSGFPLVAHSAILAHSALLGSSRCFRFFLRFFFAFGGVTGSTAFRALGLLL